MSADRPRNVAASVRQRLFNLAKETGEEFQSLLTRFALERLLYRLSQSPHRDSLILKGAFLFAVWGEHAARPTKDLDFMMYGEPGVEHLEIIVRELCDIREPSDGLEFKSESVRGAPIREDELQNGVRLKLLAYLGKARIPVQIDVGFGDAAEPPPTDITFPTMLDFPNPDIKGYRPEAVVAEKLQAMIAKGAATSRLKDYYDLWMLSSMFEFDGAEIEFAVTATFRRRGTAVPDGIPPSLGVEFTSNPDRLRQWENLHDRFDPDGVRLGLAEVAAAIRRFLLPVLEAIRTSRELKARWPPGGPWEDGNEDSR